MNARPVVLAVGAVVGVVGVWVATRAAGTVDGEPAAGSLGERLSAFLADVRAFAAEREGELREQLGLDGSHDAVDAGLS